MLEKAIEIAVAHRLVELEHKFEAKKKLKKVLEEQKVAKGRLEIALENTEAAEERVNTSENCETEPADPECVRDAAIAQTAQYVATDSAALLKKADVAVNKATRDLEEAETAIEQLEQREKDLQKTLADFIAVKQKKAAAA
jgi:DNA repair exonuclease SbcCD ATPase subunit